MNTSIEYFTIIISIYFKVILPLYIGSFFGMVYVLEWHLLIALFVCIPGLLFITPNLFKKVFNINILKSGNNFYFKNNYNYNPKNTMKVNVKNEDVIDGEYEVIKDDDKK